MTPIFSCNKPISTPDYPQKFYRILLRFRIDITIEYQDYSPVSGVRLRKTAITRSQALRSFFSSSPNLNIFLKTKVMSFHRVNQKRTPRSQCFLAYDTNISTKMKADATVMHSKLGFRSPDKLVARKETNLVTQSL